MSPLAQTSSGQTEIGGFAATLAAAQGLSSESSAASEQPAAGNIAGGIAGKIAETIAEKVAASAGTDPSAKGGQNAPLRKPLSSVASTRANTVLGVASNMVVPETVAAQAGAIAGLGSQISQGPALSATVSLPNSGGTGEDVSSRSLTAQPGGVAMASAAESASGVLRPAAGGFTLPEIIPPSTVLSPTGPAANFPAHEPSGQTPKLQLQPAMDSPAPRSATVPEAAAADADPDSSSAALSSTAAEPVAGNQDATQLPLSLSSTLSSTSTSTAPAGLMQNAQPDALSTSKLPASDTSGVTPASNLAAELQADSVPAGNPQAGLKLSEPRVLPTNDSVPLAYNAKPETLPFTTAAATADKNTLTADTQATVQESADAGDVRGAGREQFTPQPAELRVTAETAPTADAPVLLADASVETGAGAEVQTLSNGDTSANPGANLNPDQEDGGEAGTAGAVAAQRNALTTTEIANLFSGIASAPNVASPVSGSQLSSSQVQSAPQSAQDQSAQDQSAQVQAAQDQAAQDQATQVQPAKGQAAGGRILAPTAAAKANVGVTSSTSAGAGVKTSVAVQAGSAKEAESGTASPGASQTPFSVFFSSSGPGSESAASTLPKMILPGAATAPHSGFTAAPSASAGNPQSGTAQSNSLTSAGPQPMRDALAGSAIGSETASAAGSLPTGQTMHSEPAATIASTGMAQAASAPATGQTASPVVVLAAAQASVSGDSAPKPEALPPTTPGAAAGAVPTPATLVPGPVQMAQMVTRVGQSEMRVGMNTSAFGNVEVRTVVHASDVGVTIGSEKGDLRGMLANDMPAIANTLQQQNLRLNNVNFMQGFGGSNNGSSGGDAQPRSFVPTPAAANYGSPSVAMAEDSGEVMPAELRGAGNSFSILA